ncbi:MAG: RNA polymerase-binding protein DksA [Deltaproteobacteria bacterium]|nr:RNA polymerase-binding protein DksA [Deltaproteobacteria bacterium]
MKFEKTHELTPEEKLYFRSKLDEKLHNLLNESGETVQEMQGSSQEFPDPGDRANFEFERNTTLRIRDRERKLIKKVQEAIKRLEDDEYHVCEDCGDWISKERLEARPVTTLCFNCKEQQEQNEKVRKLK